VTIAIRIDRLVLDGVKLTRRERHGLAPAIERELRLLSPGRRRPPAHELPDARSRLDGIARDVAVSVHDAIGPRPVARSVPR
jgi:hypothetical protein